MKFQLDSSKPRIFPSTASPSTGLKFSFLVLSELAVNPTWPSITVTKVLPRRTLLLALTTAFAPIAVALDRFSAETLAATPMAVLRLPVVLLASALSPKAVLLLPVVLRKSALSPWALLKPPVVLLKSAKAPLALFKTPVVLLESALPP